MVIQQLEHVYQFALSITMQMFARNLNYVYKNALNNGMQMMKVNNVYKNVHCPIKLMELMIQTNVWKSVHLVNLLKMVQECVCCHAHQGPLLIIMYEFV